MKQKAITTTLAIIAMIFLTGCATVQNLPDQVTSKVQTKHKQPIMEPPQYTPNPPAEGSLWSDNGQGLFGDNKARNIGDIITVKIIENTTSKMDANTNTQRTSSMTAGITSLYGYDSKINKELLSRIPGENLLNPSIFQGTMTNAFEGKGTSDRSGQVTATIGARVVNVLPNGNLVIHGVRTMKVNFEEQNIAVSGIVRPQDITSDNSVNSTSIADAQIIYSGRGVLAEKQRPGWLVRILDMVWPF